MHFFIVFDERAPTGRSSARSSARRRAFAGFHSVLLGVRRRALLAHRASSAPTSSASCTSVSASPREALERAHRRGRSSSTDCFRVSRAAALRARARRAAVARAAARRRQRRAPCAERRRAALRSAAAVDERRCVRPRPRRRASCSDSTSVVSVARAARLLDGGRLRRRALPRDHLGARPGVAELARASALAASAVGGGDARGVRPPSVDVRRPRRSRPPTDRGGALVAAQSLLLRRAARRSSNETRLFGTRGGADDVASARAASATPAGAMRARGRRSRGRRRSLGARQARSRSRASRVSRRASTASLRRERGGENLLQRVGRGRVAPRRRGERVARAGRHTSERH